MLKITIDDNEYDAEEGMTVLEVARANGIRIPTLCFHPALRPSGACKLCAVEVPGRSGRSGTMLSCILKVKDGLEVKTESENVLKARTKAFRNLLQMAPQSEKIRQLAEAFNVDLGPRPDGCIRCRLCIRVCKEIVGAGALQMAKRDGRSFVVPVEGRCIGCGTCANLCPTGAIRVEDTEDVRTISIRDEVIGKHPLTVCEGCGKRFATPRFLDYIHERTLPHPDVKIHHRYCPTCAKLFSDRVQTTREHPLKPPQAF